MGWKIKNLESEAKPKNTREKQTTLRNIIIIPALTANRCKKKSITCHFAATGIISASFPACFDRTAQSGRQVWETVWETSVADKCGRQVWETCVGNKWETSMGDKWKTSVNSYSPKHQEPEHPESETSVRDKCDTSLNSYGPRQPEWETSVRNKWGTSVGNKPETNVKSCGPRHPEWQTSVGNKYARQVWETSVNSYGPKHPEWETSGTQV